MMQWVAATTAGCCMSVLTEPTARSGAKRRFDWHGRCAALSQAVRWACPVGFTQPQAQPDAAGCYEHSSPLVSSHRFEPSARMAVLLRASAGVGHHEAPRARWPTTAGRPGPACGGSVTGGSCPCVDARERGVRSERSARGGGSSPSARQSAPRTRPKRCAAIERLRQPSLGGRPTVLPRSSEWRFRVVGHAAGRAPEPGNHGLAQWRAGRRD